MEILILLRETYVHEYYEVQFHKKRISLRQKQMDISTYTKEFQKLVMKSKLVEPKSVKIARYMKGLRISIQDEHILMCPTIVNWNYQLALNFGEKFKNTHRVGELFRGFGKRRNFW